MARGKDKGKRGGNRGGGKGFQAQSAEEIEINNARVAAFDAERERRRAESDEEEGGEGGEGGDGTDKEREEMTKGMKVLGVKEGEDEQVIEEEVREPKRKGVSGLFATANPNAGVVKNIKIKDMNSAAAAPLSRKEREAKEKEAAAERYRARHAAGLTEEYKKDMARLEEVKRRREEARDKEEEKKRLEEETAEEIRKQKERMASKVEKKGKEEGGLEKLDKIQIKKMKPAVLKEKLKERGLAIQGNAKTLVARLLDYESKR